MLGSQTSCTSLRPGFVRTSEDLQHGLGRRFRFRGGLRPFWEFFWGRREHAQLEPRYDSRVMPAPLPNFLNSAGVSVSDWDDMAGAYADFANSIASVIRCSIFLYAYGAIYLFLRLICIAGGFNKKVQEFKDKYEEKTGWQMTFDTLRTQLLLHAPAVDDSGPEPEVDPPRDEECPESPKSPQSPPMKQAEPVVAVLVSPPREGRQRDPEDPKSPKEAESNEGVEPSNMPSNMPEVVSSI